MKRLAIIILLFFLLSITAPIGQAGSNQSQLILEYRQRLNVKPTIIETRLFKDYGYQYYAVNFVKQSTDKSIYADKIIRIVHKYENGVFSLAAYDVIDHETNTAFFMDKTKRIHYSDELDKEEIWFNKRKKLEKIKAGRFNLDYYTLPYLGKKYLRSIKRISDHVYEINKVKVKDGLAIFLHLHELISASYVMEELRIIETYRDESQGQMIRIIEAGPEIIDFNDLDTLARIAREKLDAYYPLSEKAMD